MSYHLIVRIDNKSVAIEVTKVNTIIVNVNILVTLSMVYTFYKVLQFDIFLELLFFLC